MSDLRETHDDAPEVEPMLQAAHDPHGEHPEARLSPEARARILGTLRARRPAPAFEPSPQPRPPKRRWSPIGLGLALAACLALLWVVPRLREGGPVAPESVVAHRNDDASPRLLTLADGTTLWLRQGAEIDEIEPRRLRARAGEVVIAAAPAKTPFLVESAHGSATILGEALIRAGADATAIDVVRGHVDLSPETDQKSIVRSGEEGLLRAGAAPQIAPAPRITALLAWARPLIDEGPRPGALRRGNLLARDPWLRDEWPLPLRHLHVDVLIEDGVARTTVDQTFFNPSLRTLEGVYSFPLPADAAISRLAMYVDGKLMEGGVVERQEGRTIYESIVYRRRDPALLEQMSGDEFRIRVFPLPGRQEKRLLLSYVEPLAELYGRQSLRVPLPELDGKVGSMSVEVRVKDGAALALESTSHPFQSTIDGGDRVARWSDRGVVLGDDLLLDLKPAGAAKPGAPVESAPAERPAVDAARSGDHWLFRLRPQLGAATGHTPRRWVILHDTSASRDAAELAAQERLLAQILRALDPGDRFALLAFDTSIREVVALRPVAGVDPAAVRSLAAAEGRAHVGATDLTEALARARTILDADPREGEAPTILYLGDGLSHGSGQDVDAQRRALGEGAPFVAAALGDAIDRDRLAALADASGGLVTVVDPGEDMAWRALDLLGSIATSRLVDVRVDLEDASGSPIAGALVDPSRRSLADGEALLVTATATAAPAAIVVEGTLDGRAHRQRIALESAREGAGYVDPLWARGRVRSLLAEDAEAHRETITAIGLDHFLVTPYTSLLVVESEAMARQFKLRLPKADGWAHYPSPATIPVKSEPLGRLGEPPPGVYVMRSALPVLQDSARNFAAEYHSWGLGADDIIGAGGLGLRGIGRGGGGTGEGLIGLGSEAGGGEASFSGALFDLAANAEARPDAPWIAGGTLPDTVSFGREEQARSTRSLLLKEAGGASMSRHAFAGRGYYGYGMAARQIWPQALHYRGDVRLDDLTEFIPALFEGTLDREREALLAVQARVGAGAITPEARELLERARAVMPVGRYRGPDGEILDVDVGDKIVRIQTIGGYLEERATFDGVHLVHHYPGLDLAVRRNLAGGELLLRDRWAPWTLASADALAAAYVVERLGERALRLRPPAAEGAVVDTLDVEFDEALRLTKIVRRSRGIAVATTTITIVGQEITVDRGSGPRIFRREADAPAIDAAAIDAVTIDLPYRGPEEAQERLAAQTPGTAPWRAALHQRLASLLALRRGHEGTRDLVALVDGGAPLRRGELVLAAAIVRHLDAGAWSRLRRGLVDDDPVAAYITAIRTGDRAFAPLRARLRGTLPGMMASYRTILVDGERPRDRASIDDLATFLADYHHDPLDYIATWRIVAGMSWTRAELAAEAWTALADAAPRWSRVARHGAGMALYQRGQTNAAAPHFIALFDRLEVEDEPPIVDWAVRQTIQSARGEATWHLLWSRWRAHVETSGSPKHLLAFVDAALRLSETDAIHRVIARADLSRLDLDTGLALCEDLLVAGMEAEARPVLRAMRNLAPESADVQIVGARVAERLGDLAQAAAALEKAAESPEITDLRDLRALFRQSFELRARLSQAATDAKVARAAIDAALAVAARWRQEDPDNAEIDELSASLLYAHGLSEEAWRHLSSVVERHPAEGEAYAKVAALLAREGDLAAADRTLQEAAKVEPTNPTWPLRRAQSLLAAGDPQGARELLQAIDRGRWQDRFASAQSEARGLLRHLDEASAAVKRP